MSDGYNLIYYHKETGKKYEVKRVTRLDYRIRDPEDETKTSLALSAWALSRSFRADKDNAKNQKKVQLNFRNRPKESENNI